MNIPITGLPGVGTARTAHPRELVAANAQAAQYVPGLCVVDGSKSRDPLNGTDVDVLRAGTLLGKTTANGKYAVSVIGVTLAAAANGASSITVAPAVAAEIVRRIGSTGSFKLTGPAAANGTAATQTVTFTGVNTTTGVVTCTPLTAAAVAGSFVQPTDGSETILTLLANRWGLKVTDFGGSSTDVLADQLLLAGHVRTANVVNYPTDLGLIAFLKSALHANCPAMTFDDAF